MDKITIPDCDGIDLTLLTVALTEYRNAIQHSTIERILGGSWNETLTRLDNLVGKSFLEVDNG